MSVFAGGSGVGRTATGALAPARPGAAARSREARARLVGALSFAVMAVELGAGLRFNSLALISDGLHTSTHVGVMIVTAAAYAYTRRHASDPRFTFGTGKVGDLAAFASGAGLAVFAIFIGLESMQRLIRPEAVAMRPAAGVAALSLAVGLVSAALLREARAHTHAHAHAQQGVSHRRGRDLNLWAAYLHMLSDVVTSGLAIAALLAGAALGWTWLDAAVGLVNAAVVAGFAARLLSRASAVLLDIQPQDAAAEAARRLAGERFDQVRVWSVGPGRLAVVVRGAQASPHELAAKLAGMPGLEQVLVEVGEPPR